MDSKGVHYNSAGCGGHGTALEAQHTLVRDGMCELKYIYIYIYILLRCTTTGCGEDGEHGPTSEEQHSMMTGDVRI